jgi:putative 4-mercaptohistidine N1-methyltranferase
MDNAAYESAELLHQYLLFHYGPSAVQLPWPTGPATALGFPQRCVREGVDFASLKGHSAALDVGCAVGGATFELSRHFERSVGIDYSHAFVEAARRLLAEGELEVEIVETGTRRSRHHIRRPEGTIGSLQFEQGDAHALRPDLGQFEVVLACNLLCRLARPVAFLSRLPDLVRPGGQLIITTPNSWLESFTAREFWIGATPETGEPLEALEAMLRPAFRPDRVWDMPFLIREHARKYQWSVAQASRWIRVSDSN